MIVSPPHCCNIISSTDKLKTKIVLFLIYIQIVMIHNAMTFIFLKYMSVNMTDITF